MRRNKKVVSIVNRVFLSTLLFCFTSLTTFAIGMGDNVLSGVEIKNSDNGYAIVLKSDKPSQVRKTVESNNEVVLQISGMIPSESVGTIYNNVPAIENVIIQEMGNNKTEVLIRGKNIAYSKIGFEPSSNMASGLAVNNEAKEKISLNAPVAEYAPIYDENVSFETVEEPENFMSTVGSLTNSATGGFLPVIKKAVKYVLKMDKKYFALGGMFLLIILFGMNALKPNKESEMKIGLSQSLKDRELDMRDELSLNNSQLTLRNRMQTSETSAPSINYGLKAYQNSQKNPYTSQLTGIPKKKTNPVAPVYNKALIGKQAVSDELLQAAINKKPRPRKRKPLPPVNQTPAITKPAMPTNAVKNVDSMKFLESMAKIYEKNGRADLASELKSNIKKVKVTKS